MPNGANIFYSRSKRLSQTIGRVLRYPPTTFGGLSAGKLCRKDGVPATDTPDDAPNAKGDLCFDNTNNRVYICTDYEDTNNFTWVRIDG